jgi:hypothetical protein
MSQFLSRGGISIETVSSGDGMGATRQSYFPERPGYGARDQNGRGGRGECTLC